jgi:hypothetical protein
MRLAVDVLALNQLADYPYERIDGVKPVNNRYEASVIPLLGTGMPSALDSPKVTITATSLR